MAGEMDETVIGTDGRQAGGAGALELETTAGIVFSSQLSGIWSEGRVSQAINQSIREPRVINSINERETTNTSVTVVPLDGWCSVVQ